MIQLHIIIFIYIHSNNNQIHYNIQIHCIHIYTFKDSDNHLLLPSQEVKEDYIIYIYIYIYGQHMKLTCLPKIPTLIEEKRK
jgi:hypothetical protein